MAILNEEVVTEADFCDLANRWSVDPRTMELLSITAKQFEFQTGRTVWIISGFRTAAEQRGLERAGRPTAPDELSTHRSCPATGVDIWLGVLPSNLHKAIWGQLAFFNGLRWGGGGPIDPETGIPKDWPHVDRGPRVS